MSTPQSALSPTLSARDPLLPTSRVTALSLPPDDHGEQFAERGGSDAHALHARIASGGTMSVLEIAAAVDMPVGVVKEQVHRLHAAELVHVAPTVEPGTRAAQRVLTHLATPTPVVSVAPTAASARVVATGPHAARVLHSLGDVEIVSWLMPAPPQEHPATNASGQARGVVQHQTWFAPLAVASDVVVYVTADHPPCDVNDQQVLRDTIALVLTLDPDAPQACASLAEQCRRSGVPVVATTTGTAREDALAHELGVELVDLIALEDLWDSVASQRPRTRG